VASGSTTQPGGGAMLMVIPTPELLFTVHGEAIAGDDVRALMVLGSAVWRPRL